MSIYRKIYEQYYGPIPKDKDGRSYEIHHIDGNHSNDDIDNLKCVSIQEHYDIHYAQGDWGACQSIAARMELSHKELSELATKNNLKRVAEGTNPFQTRSDGTNISSDRVKDGTHQFLGGKIQQKTSRRRVEEGTHNFLDGTISRESNLKRIANGTHLFITNNPSHKRMVDGTHLFITNNPSKNIQQITCPYCPKTGGSNIMKRWHFDKCKFNPNFI